MTQSASAMALLCQGWPSKGYSHSRDADGGFHFTVDLVPDQKKVNFHHWVGLLVHKGKGYLISYAAVLQGHTVSTPMIIHEHHL